MIFNLRGSFAQNAIIQQGIDRCEFDFDKMAPSLAREGKQQIAVEWADLSRYNHSTEAHDHAEGAHTIVREVDGRKRVLGLFYLPPHTKIVLDLSLANQPLLAIEVFLAEVAHAVDYHFMTHEMRRRFVNSLHVQQLPITADVSDGASFDLDGHTCSWFDVNVYAMWCGEAFMEGFIEATSDVKVTINLGHPVGPEDRAVIREFLGIDPPPVVEPEPAPEPTPEPAPEREPVVDPSGNLETALRRYLGTKSGARSPLYLREAANAWLASR